MQEREYITKETDLHSDVRKVKPDNGGGARNREGTACAAGVGVGRCGMFESLREARDDGCLSCT